MLEIYINPKFRHNAPEIKSRCRNFNFFQLVDPLEFNKVNAKNEIKFGNNPFHKVIRIGAN